MRASSTLCEPPPSTPQDEHGDPFLHQTMNRLAGLAKRTDDIAHLMRVSLSEAIRLHLLDDYIPPPNASSQGETDRRPLTDAQERLLVKHIDAQLEARHNLADMAGLVGLSIADLLVAFSASFGSTPYQFVIARRIRKAKLLLATTRTSVTEIGLATGFSTPSHFATSFKKSVGLSPSAYRSAAGG